MFVNGGDFEILSMPKIIGSVCGGIVVTKNLNFMILPKKNK